MKTMKWLLVCAALGGMALGCGDDDSTTDASTEDSGGGDTGGGDTGGEDGSTPEVSCGAIAGVDTPDPDSRVGACCSRVKNTDKQEAPELRLIWLGITEPSVLTSTSVAGGLLNQALEAELFNWLLQVEVDGTTANITTGLGWRQADGTFQFANGDAPTDNGGEATRFDPISITGTMEGEVLSAPAFEGTFTVPVFDEMNPDEIVLELPLQGFEIEMATLSDERSCVGNRVNARRYNTDAGSLTTFLTIEDTVDAEVNTTALQTTVCNLLAGLNGEDETCADTPRADWPSAPNASCTAGVCNTTCSGEECNAWQVSGGFAAHGVEIN